MRDSAGRGAEVLASLIRVKTREDLHILLSNNLTTTRYPAIVARELGLFEKAGLRIGYLDARTEADYVDLLFDGAADAVMLDAPQTLQAVDAGRPIAAVFESMQKAPDVLSVVDGGPIATLADLRGRTIGLASDRDLVTARLVLDTAGVDISEVRTIIVGDHGPAVAETIRSGQIDAYAASVNDVTVLVPLGIVLRDLTPPALKANPANSFCIEASRLEELRPQLGTFFRAWSMAIRAAKLDPEAVAAMCQAAVPAEWQDAEAGRALMDAAVALNTSVTEQLGAPEPAVWDSLQRSYRRIGLLDGAVDPAAFLDGSLIAVANDFVDDEILAALRAWKTGRA
jgi:ABC-type nitrate/sulfonate/bicarbonate transport system substrate-binding protein